MVPNLVLSGNTPRLIDEWQVEPGIWNHVRREIDDRGKPGQFILTGSAVPSDDVIRHTGAGRILRLRMRPMSLAESGHSTGEVSLSELFEGQPASCQQPTLSIEDIATLISTGGWPGMLHLKPAQAQTVVRGYVDEIVRADINRVDGIDRDPVLVERFLISCARNISTLVSNNTLANDAGGRDGPLDPGTVNSYLSALQRLMVIEDAPPWSPNLRSRSRLRAASKRLFVDPSIAVAALGVSPGRLLLDLEFLGFLFEALVFRDLRVFAQAMDAKVLHYRDSTGLEVDAVVETPDGRWAAFEIKLGQHRIDQGAASLLKLARRINTDRHGKPAALGVIVPKGYGYRRPDGVDVIPIGALGA